MIKGRLGVRLDTTLEFFNLYIVEMGITNIEVMPRFINYIFVKMHFLLIYILFYNLRLVLNFLKNYSKLGFKMFIDLIGVDLPGEFKRFKLVYNLLNLFNNLRCFVITFVKERFKISTVTDIFFCADWSEREAWDLLGIPFYSNFSLKRILTDYGFKGFPLRKDFPLSGYFEIFYNIYLGLIKFFRIELTQELRFFNFNSE